MKPTHILAAFTLAFGAYMAYELLTTVGALLARIPSVPTV